MYYLQQREIENTTAKHNMALVLEPAKEQLLPPCEAYVYSWLGQDFDFENRADLVEIVGAVHSMDIAKTCWKMLTKVILDRQVTLQALFGMFFHDLPVDMPYRKGRVLEPFITAMLQHDFIKLEHIGKYLHLVCTRKVSVPTGDYSYVLPSIIPTVVKQNNRAGYETNQFHVITGSPLKRHDGELCLDHINRQNHIMYRYDFRHILLHEPEFSDEPKFLTEKGRYENQEEIELRRKQFNLWKDELPQKTNVLYQHGNQFCFKHRYDVRGRTYAKAWHLDYIGNKFCRATVNTTTHETAMGADKYFD